MSLFNRNPVIDTVWELTKKQYPEWNAPRTPNEGVSEEEMMEDVDYSESEDEDLTLRKVAC